MSSLPAPGKILRIFQLLGCYLLLSAGLALGNEPPPLTVVAAYGGKEAIFTEFHKKTGIRIEFLDMPEGEVLARAETEGGKPLADLWFGGAADSLIKAGQKGLLEVYRSPEADTVPTHYKDPDGYWTGVSLILAGFLVNTELLNEKKLPVPHLWDDLIKPEYHEMLLVADPAISGTSYTTVACLLQKKGPDEGWQYLEALGRNVQFFSKRSSDPEKKVIVGQAAISVVPLSRELLSNKTLPQVQAVVPKDGIPWTPACMAIFRNARNLSAAKAFVDWALSVEGQKIIQEKDPRIMVRPEIPIPKEMDSISLADLIPIDIIRIGTERQRILATWAQRIPGRP